MSTRNIPKFTVYEDDEIRTLIITWQKQDVSAFTDLRFLLERPSPAAVLEIVATNIDLPNGRFSFPFSTGDLVEGLGQRANVRVINATAEPLVIAEFIFDVLPRVTP